MMFTERGRRAKYKDVEMKLEEPNHDRRSRGGSVTNAAKALCHHKQTGIGSNRELNSKHNKTSTFIFWRLHQLHQLLMSEKKVNALVLRVLMLLKLVPRSQFFFCFDISDELS